MVRSIKSTGVFALAAAALLSVPVHAQEVQVKNESFSVTLPAGYTEPAKQTQKTQSPEGEIETTNWVARAAATGEAVVVTMSRMPAKILDPAKLISSTRDSLLKSLSATLESEEPRQEEANSSRLLFKSAGALFRSRLVVVDDRLYQLLYVGRSEEHRSAPAVGQIFESFRIHAPVKTPETATAQ